MKTLRFTMFAIGLIAVLALAACAGGVAQPTAAPPTAASTQPTTAAPQATTAPAQPTTAPSTGGNTIKIGGGFALTGDESSLDLPAANGAKLAVKEINTAGGVLGKQLELVTHDTQYKMDVTAQVCKQFVEQDKVIAVVGFTDTDSVLACGPIIQKAGLPFITAGATSPKIPSQVGDKMFLAPFGDNVQAAAGAEFAAQKFGKNAYLLWDKGVEYTTLLADYFKKRFTDSDLGGKIVLEDSYDDKATDFSAQITKIKALPTQPDFYYVAAMPYNVGTVVKQMRDAGLTGPIVGGDGYDDPSWVAAVGSASNNVFFSTHALNDPNKAPAAYKKFFQAYQAEYGRDPENAFAALGYDSVYLLVDAIKRANSTDANAITQALRATKNFPGITGNITYDASQVPQKGVTIIELKDGKYTLGAQLVPQKVAPPQ